MIRSEYVDGPTLAEVIARHRAEPVSTATGSITVGPVPADSRRTTAWLDWSVRMVEAIARSLHEAHEAGVVHRDIKPGNIVIPAECLRFLESPADAPEPLTPAAVPVLIDFGLARSEEDDPESLTRSNDLFGTPACMSPEQLLGGRFPVDRRPDVWSLGATLYECLALRKAFDAPTRGGLHAAIRQQEPSAVHRVDRSIPRDLSAVVHTALQKDRDRRYQSALAFAEDLRRVLRREPVSARPVPLVVRGLRWSRRNPWKAGTAVSAFCALLAAVILLARLPEIRAGREAARGRALDLRETGRGHQGDSTAFERAREYLARAVVGSPMALPNFEMAHVLGHLKAAADAERFAKGLVTRWPDSAEAWHWAGFAERSTAPARAETAFRRALALRPGSALYRCRVTDALFDQGRLKEAARAYEECLALDPADTLAPTSLGNTLRNLGDHERAIEVYRRSGPESPGALTGIGNVFERLGRDTEAAEAYEQALAIDGRHFDALLGLGILGSRPGLETEALEMLDRARSVDPGSIEALYSHAAVLLRLERFVEAEPELRTCHARDPRNAHASNALGQILVRTGRDEEALGLFRQCLATDAGHHPAWLGLGNAFKNLGLRSKALEAYDACLHIDPRNAKALVGKGNVRRLEDRWAEALEFYDQAIQAAPDDHLGWFDRGLALRKLDRAEDAAAAFREAIRRRPGHSGAHEQLLEVLELQGGVSAACDEKLRWAESRPEDVGAWVDAVRSFLRAARREPDDVTPERALECSRRANTATSYRNARILFLAAAAEAECNATDEALLLARRAFALVKAGGLESGLLADSRMYTRQSSADYSAMVGTGRPRAYHMAQDSCHMTTIGSKASAGRKSLVSFGARRGRDRGPFESIQRIRDGLPGGDVRRFLDRYGFSLDDLDRFLRMPKSTTARTLRERRRFTPVQSEKLNRLVETLALAVEVLEEVDRALRWLREPNRALGGEPPLALLDTDSGARLVEDTLYRIEHGVHS